MTNFTDNPLEKMMRQTPRAKPEFPVKVAPKGHHCYGCVQYGQGCVAPCYRDLLKYMDKEAESHDP